VDLRLVAALVVGVVTIMVLRTVPLLIVGAW
jgi:hypothetical protein